ncbi:hypothetical protein MTO96_002603 [Rhipicephalus appendiculatus]
MRRCRMKDHETIPVGGAHAGSLQDTAASPDSNLAACATISEVSMRLAHRRLRTRDLKLDQDKGNAASAPLQDLGQTPAAMETTTRCAALLKHSKNKEHGKSDAGAIPEHIIQLCKRISDKQLVSKLKRKGKHHGIDMVTAINQAGSEMRLQRFPRPDTHEVLSLMLPFLVSSQQANETLPSKKEISKALAFGKTTASQRNARKEDISSVLHTLTAKRKSSRTTMSSLLVQDTLVAKVHDAVSGKTMVVTPACNLVVELDRLTPEEVASFTCQQQSSVQNKTAQERKDGDCCFQVTGKPKSMHDARAPGHGQSQGQHSVHSCSVQETDDFKGGASNTDVPVLQKQPCQNYSSWSDHDEDSPSLLEPELCQSLQLSPPLPQTSCEGTHSKRLGVRIGNPVQKEFADQPTDKHLLSATTDPEENSQERRCVPSALDPPMSEARSVHVQDSPQGTKRHIVRSVSPDVLHAPKRHRMRFTALQEEALVYGVMKYGRGSWKEIGEDGWFNGRRTTELSDKYRNLEKYGHLPKVKRRVRDMLSAGVNPLKELRALYDRQRLQRATSPTAEELLHCKQRPASQPKELRGTSPVRCPPDGDSTTTSSDDDAFVEPLQKQAETQKAVDLPKTVCSSPCRPSTSQAHQSSQSRWNSGSETDVSQEAVPIKLKEKRRRVPFTPLEEEALVAGVLKFGKGNWLRILTEGGFLGRTSTQLSDKYRNLKLYRQLDAIERTVKSKRDKGEDPLEELRRLSAAHWKR